MGTVEVARPHRELPRSPEGELALQAPPEPEKLVPGGILMRLLPLVMLVGSLGFVVVLGVRNPTSWLFGGMFAISTLGMMATGGGRGSAARASTIDEARREYLRYLGQMRRTLRAAAAAQRVSAEDRHPEPEAWPAVVAGRRLWERGPADADFGHVRIGRGTQRLSTRLIAPETGPPDGLEPVTALALRRFLIAHAVVPDLPVALSLRQTATIWLEPDGAAARALARAVVAQFVLWHSPADARLAVVAAPAVLSAWEWAKWLPHNAHPRRRDGAGALRMFTPEADALRRWWAGEPAPSPHLLVVVDGVADGLGPWAGVPGVTVLRIGAPIGRRPASAVLRLRITAEGLERVVQDAEPVQIGAPDALSSAQAAALARRLARYRPAGGAEDAAARAAPGLPALLGLRPGPAGIDALRTRWRRAAADRLRVPIGVDERGAAVVLDLKESAQGGSGPHGLCIGATGSGNAVTVLWHN
jgi:ESX secretion system protein EccC